MREMTHEEGGMFSAQDADSYEREGDEKKKEGAFYVWRAEEVSWLHLEEDIKCKKWQVIYM